MILRIRNAVFFLYDKGMDLLINFTLRRLEKRMSDVEIEEIKHMSEEHIYDILHVWYEEGLSLDDICVVFNITRDQFAFCYALYNDDYDSLKESHEGAL